MPRYAVFLAAFAAFVGGCQKSDAPSSERANSAKPLPSAARPLAETKKAPSPIPAPVKKSARPLLWQIDDGKGHLFGTMHLGVDADRDVSPAAWSAFAASKRVVLEIESGAISLAQQQELLFMPKGFSMRKGLNDAQWNALRELTGMPEGQLVRMSPLMATVLVTSKWLPMTTPLDQTIEKRARAQDKTVAGLETFAETKVFAQSLTHVKYLAAMLDDVPKAKRELEAMHRAYLAGDADAMATLVFSKESLDRFPELYEQLFYTRNQNWIPRIEAQLAQGKTFVAVGAGHLVGDKSVVALLRAKGHKVERVPLAP